MKGYIMKNRFLKLVLACLMLVNIVLCIPEGAKASSFGLSASATTIYVGDSVTVYVNGNVAGRFDASVSGGTLNTSTIFIDYPGNGGSFTLTATQVGTMYVKVSATDATDASYNTVTGSQGLNITVKQRPSSSGSSGNSSSSSSGNSGGNSSSSSSSTTTPSVEEEKADVTLKSLKVSEGSLTPTFSSDEHNYEVVVGNKTEKITVEAEASDTNATVEGTGEISLEKEETKVEIKVSNEEETGIYTIVVIKETPVVSVEGIDGELGILNEFRGASVLEGFEDYTITIDKVEVKAKRNPVNDLVVVYAMDEDGNKSYYIYNEKKAKITSIYKPIALLGNNYAIITIPKKYKEMEGFKFGTVEVSGSEFEGWTYVEEGFENYVLLYLMDEKGKAHLYQYDKSEDTLQIYDGSAPVTKKTYSSLLEERDMYKLMTFILAPVAALIAIMSIVLAIVAKKKTKK